MTEQELLELSKVINVDDQVHQKVKTLAAKGKYPRMNEFLRAVLKLDSVEAKE